MEVLNVLLTIVYVICCLFLGFVVLIQKGEGGGLGGAFGGGAVDQAFGAKADMTWKRATAVAAATFMVLAIFLGIVQSQMQHRSVAAQEAKKLQEAAAQRDGAATDGAATDGAAADGAAADGAATDGAATDGAATDGAATDGAAGTGESE